MNKAVEDEAEPPLGVLMGRKREKRTKVKRKNQATTSKDQNLEAVPVQIEPLPIQIEPEPVQIEPEPLQIEPEPVQIEPEPVQIELEPVHIEPEPVQTNEDNGPGISVSMFDHSWENHSRAMHTIAKLCGEDDEENQDHLLEDSEIQRLSSLVTFLREWADFKYKPREVRFACGKEAISGTTLPQFSSAAVPKKEALSGEKSSPELSQDFVMYVGGPVWALDWCPRVHQSPDYHPKCEVLSNIVANYIMSFKESNTIETFNRFLEKILVWAKAPKFIAIAVHPPGSSYHKLGEPLTGRGAIQIWCLLNAGVNEGNIHPIGEKSKWGRKNSVLGQEKLTELKRPIGRPRKKPIEENSTEPKRPRGRPRKVPVEESIDKEVTEHKSTRPKRPRGRPPKKTIEESVDNLDGSSSCVENLAIEYPEESLELHSTDCVPANTQGHAVQDHGKKRKSCKDAASECNPALESSVRRKFNTMEDAESNNSSARPPLFDQNEEEGSPVSDHHMHQSSGQDPQTSHNIQSSVFSKIDPTKCSVQKDVALPRIVLSLAHHGKVAWDVKWRPPSEHDSKCKHRMGYLAVLLGNGSLEVWDVPLPRAMEVIYSSSSGEGTDPRFVKLAPVFRCSMLKCGGGNSIPLTVEWSTSPAHDYLLAGCHDGTVALWKFSASNPCTDTRPLLCFSADTNPIRALAWAPVESNSEGANVIVTAGHGGLKFWDLRDPFRPLWDIDHLPKFIYSLDWLPDPRCVLLSFDDGAIKVISLVKAASDDPVTGMVGTKQPGLHNLSFLPFAIWSVHVSRITGLAAYCCADGTVLRFQLTSKALDKDPRRNRAPHFLCMSVTMEESAVTIKTPVSSTPFPLKVAPLTRNNTESKKVKTANDKMAKALCNGDDLGSALKSGGKVASSKSKKTQKSGSSKKKSEADLTVVCIEQEIGEKAKKSRSSKKARNDHQSLVCVDEAQTDTQEEYIGKANSKKAKKSGPSNKKVNEDQELVCIDEEATETREEEETGKELQAFPDKLVAMHRVRWNMNKGSERWLCYGGAAGLVRCQEIVLSDIERAWAAKR